MDNTKRLKAYKYRLYPNANQISLLNQHFGCARFVYNWALDKKTKAYKDNKINLSRRELQDSLVKLKKEPDTKWLSEVNSQTLLASLLNLDTAFKNFFKKNSKFPRFKKKYNGHQSFQCPQHVTVNFLNNTVNLPKIKNIKIKLHREFSGKIKTCTISKTPTNKFYISILVDNNETIPIPTTIEPNHTIGIDFGIKSLAITSDKQCFANNKFLSKNCKKLKTLQRRHAKKTKNSNNRIKAKLKLAKLHEKIASQRLDTIHQITAELVYKNHATCFALEDLHVKGMLSNHKLAKAIADSGFGLLRNKLEYKSKWSGKNVILAGRFDPSSKQCSNCHNIAV